MVTISPADPAAAVARSRPVASTRRTVVLTAAAVVVALESLSPTAAHPSVVPRSWPGLPVLAVVGILVAVAVEEPVSKAFEVGRAVAAATSAFVDRDNRCEQLRNRSQGPTSELFALGPLAVRSPDEPHAQALPSLVPHLQFGFVGRLLFARGGVAW